MILIRDRLHNTKINRLSETHTKLEQHQVSTRMLDLLKCCK